MSADMEPLPIADSIRDAFFPDHEPARTTLEFSNVHKVNYLIEIEAIPLARSVGNRQAGRHALVGHH